MKDTVLHRLRFERLSPHRSRETIVAALGRLVRERQALSLDAGARDGGAAKIIQAALGVRRQEAILGHNLPR